MKSPDPIPHSPDPVEDRLQTVRPAPLPAALFTRLQQARPAPWPAPGPRSQELRFPAWILWTAASAAAIALVGWGFQPAPPSEVRQGAVSPIQAQSVTEAAPAQSGPDGESMEFYPALASRQHLLSVRDLGVVHDSRDRAVRLMSTTWLDENTYGNAGSGGKPALHESRFRHEIVPVLLPTY